MEPVLEAVKPKVTQEMNHQLTKPVSKEEIFEALQQMQEDKTPGPDGFNMGFYKQHLSAIKKGVINFVKHFFQT